jgi:hypothetical protein
MARLPDEIITTVFSLQRQLLEGIDDATVVLITLLINEASVTLEAIQASIAEIKRIGTYYE